MNKKTYIKYHREVKDKEGKDLKVGDIVIYHDSYYNDVHRGIITHFTDRNVIIKRLERKWVIKSQRCHNNIIKVANGFKDFPELGKLLDSYGEYLCKEEPEEDYEISSM